MKFTIKHEIRGRIRIHNCQKTMSADQADERQYYLITKDFFHAASFLLFYDL